MNNLRKVILPLDASAKIVKPRLLHSSQHGYICPLDTPDGGNVGLHLYPDKASNNNHKFRIKFYNTLISQTIFEV